MNYTGERFFPLNNDISLMALEHLHRYNFAVGYVKGKVCLDIASGEGYGSALLAEKAERVVGCDVDNEAVKWANEKYHKNNLFYRKADIAALDFDDETFDVITCFETIEHISEEAQQQAIRGLKRVLKRDGYLFISTPNTASSLHCKHNKYHQHEMSTIEFKTLLQKHFKFVHCFGQSVYCSSIISDKENEDIQFISLGGELSPYDDKYIIAICSDSDIAILSGKSVCIDASKSVLRQLTKIKNVVGWSIPVYNFMIQMLSFFVFSKKMKDKIRGLKW